MLLWAEFLKTASASLLRVNLPSFRQCPHDSGDGNLGCFHCQRSGWHTLQPSGTPAGQMPPTIPSTPP